MTITVNDPEQKTNVTSVAPNKAENGIKSHLIENVSVRLEAYLGGSRMTVAELSALKNGELVTLDAPLTQAVELRLNGLAVAKGELVSVGDRFAVRILEVSK